MKTKYTMVISLLLLLTLGEYTMQVAYAGSSGTSTGTATVITDFTIRYPELYTGETDKNASALTVATAYHINLTVIDQDTCANFENITVRIWDSGYGGVTENSTDAERNHYSVVWQNSTNTWTGTPSGFLTGSTVVTDWAAVQTEFDLTFDLSKVANHTNGAAYVWKVSMFGYDGDDHFSHLTGSDCLMFDVESYTELSSIESPHSWAALTPNSDDNELDVPADHNIGFTVIANVQWNVTSLANASVLISQYSNTMGIGNITINSVDTVGESIPLTNVTATEVPGLTAQAAPALETGTATQVWLWIDVPANQEPGDYEYELTLAVVDDQANL